MPTPLFPSSYKAWADEHQELLDLTVQILLATGTWPTLDQLQRDLVRRGVKLDVGDAAFNIPQPLGFRQGQQLVLTLFGLRLTSAAAPLLDGFMEALRTAAARYADPSESRPSLSDLDLRGGAPVLEIVGREAPFLGSSVGTQPGQRWAREVDRAIARYLDIHNIDDYLRQRRDELKRSPQWRWPEEESVAPSPPKRRLPPFDGRGAMEFLLATATIIGLWVATPHWLTATAAATAFAYGLARTGQRTPATVIVVLAAAWTIFSLAHDSSHRPAPPATGIVGFVGGCAPYQVYAQDRWRPYGALIHPTPSTLSRSNGAYNGNQVIAVNGWVESQVAYPTNTAPFNNDIWFHLADGAGWVSFGGVRATPVAQDPTGLADGGPPAPAPKKCEGAVQ
ncbi:hypothetical protein [Conexibacter woesei]|uniref:hypothetical protein n=1 Tax=Conexibacter woesei TaxID=191495 RepID=UPI0005531DDC|nr:hypothetical protein [Conexibacter woesei]